MTELRELYQQLILDHGRKPRNHMALTDATHLKQGHNPVCGDQLTVFIKTQHNKIIDISFVGEGCAISVASASLMTEILKNKTVEQAQQLFDDFHQLLTGEKPSMNGEIPLGKLEVLAGVAKFPVRVKCATLCWHTMAAALAGSAETVSTE